MGLFSRKIAPSSKFEENEIAITSVKNVNEKEIEDLNKAFLNGCNNLSQSSAIIGNSAKEIESSIDDLTNSSVQQDDELNDVNTLLHSFRSNMESLAYNVVNVQIKVFETDKLTDDGLNTFIDLDRSLSSLQSSFNVLSKTVNDLVAKLESVNLITDSISQIASQTNLLSLNAAIEAARAGEAGKGFSVVAGEVRKLAENSKHSVESITSILNEIKNDILTASKAMQEGNKSLENQHTTLANTKESFTNIKANSTESKDEIDQCIVNLTNTSSDKDKLIESIEGISKVSHHHVSICNTISKNNNVQLNNIDKINKEIERLSRLTSR